MTKRLLIFALIAALNLFLLLYSGGELFFFLLLFQFFVLLMSAINLALSLFGVTLRQDVSPESAVKGDRISLTFEVHNGTLLPFGHITLWYVTPGGSFTGEERCVSATVMPRTKRVLRESEICRYRGEYYPGFTRIEATDLFGLLRFGISLDKFRSYHPASLLVYPRLSEILSEKFLRRVDQAHSGSESSAGGEPDGFAGLRDYMEGDRLRDVDWKRSVSAGEPLVRQREGTLSPESVIVVDCTAHRLGGEEAARVEDSICEVAASFCKQMTDAYMPLELVIYSSGREEYRAAGPDGFQPLYELLARQKFGGQMDIAAGIELERKEREGVSSLFVITHSPTDALYSKILELAGSGILITLVFVIEKVGYDERTMRMLGEFALRGITAITILPGEDLSHRLEGAQ